MKLHRNLKAGLLASALSTGLVLVVIGCGGGGGGGTVPDVCADPYADLPDTGSGTRVRGRVLTLGGNVVPNVRVRIYNSGGTELGNVVTNSCGAYYFAPGTTPASFQLDSSTIVSTLYKEYRFNGSWYSSVVVGCRASYTALSAGNLNTLPTIFMDRTISPPPPPPTGCP